MKLNFRLLDSNASIQKKILNALYQDAVPFLANVSRKAQTDVRSIVKKGIENSDEYRSIVSGNLRLEFGIPNGASVLNNLLTVWEQVFVDYKKPRINSRGIDGSISISMIRSDYADALSADGAVVITEKGQSLPWLEWLLLFGDKVIIRDYEVVIGPSKYSRTGGAIMRESTKGRWSVPNAYAGTARNNWITRTIDSLESDINNALHRALRESL